MLNYSKEILHLIDRENPLFSNDVFEYENELSRLISTSRFLVLGGAGSIGQAVCIELFKRNPKKLHVVDISENNLVELVRDLRSSVGYIDGEFKTFALDICSQEYDAFNHQDGAYDYVLNLSALKHVRSEKDPFTLMRLIKTNIINTEKTIIQSINSGAKKYFCVSTDKATNPVNLMGGSKRIMEKFIMRRSSEINISTARFANVAFSDGSLLHGFQQRLMKRQPIVAPTDVKRYFVTPQEAGELCVLSSLLGGNRDIFYPKITESFKLVSFADIAMKVLKLHGLEPVICDSEDEARAFFKQNNNDRKWPCLFTVSDTTGEKPEEEFYTDLEVRDTSRFQDVGVIKNVYIEQGQELDRFYDGILALLGQQTWDKADLVSLFKDLLPEMTYKDVGKYLDGKM